MAEPVCDVLIQGGIFHPGDVITGSIKCNFQSETKVRGIKVRFKGTAKVSWQEQRTTYQSNVTYFNMESEMLTDETTFPPGVYAYPFSFTLPNQLPTTLSHDTAKIKYSIKAIVDRPWAFDYTSKKNFIVENVLDLNMVDSVKQALQFKKKKYPFSLKAESHLITLTVDLPQTGFVPSEMVCFRAQVKNDSNVNVKGLHFQLVQGFHFLTEWRNKTVITVKSEEFAVVDGLVRAGSEKSWDLELRVPHDVHNGIYTPCDIIKSYFELRGELVLPFMYKNSKIVIPLMLGSVPLRPA